MGCHPWWLKKALMRWSLSRLDRRVFTFCQLVIGPLRETQRKREVRTNYGFWWRRAEVRRGCFQSEFLKEIKHHHSGLFLTACLKSAPSDGNWMLRLRTSYPCEQNFKNVDVSFSCCDWDWTMETVLFVWPWETHVPRAMSFPSVSRGIHKLTRTRAHMYMLVQQDSLLRSRPLFWTGVAWLASWWQFIRKWISTNKSQKLSGFCLWIDRW